jgi:hypothetical protein
LGCFVVILTDIYAAAVNRTFSPCAQRPLTDLPVEAEIENRRLYIRIQDGSRVELLEMPK